MRLIAPALALLMLVACSSGEEESVDDGPPWLCVENVTPPEGYYLAEEHGSCLENEIVKVRVDENFNDPNVNVNVGAFRVRVTGLGGMPIQSMSLFFLQHGKTRSFNPARENGFIQNVKIGIWGAGPVYNMRLNRKFNNVVGGAIKKEEINNNQRFQFNPWDVYVFTCDWNSNRFGCTIDGEDGSHHPWFEIGLKDYGWTTFSSQEFSFGSKVYANKTAGTDVRVLGFHFGIFLPN